ncbi:MAG: hypothetical protein NTY68_01085, partial [Candidatus Micrarchaeota archaeon]|nr:hypothetical protein [Candidatus Micrarchaeota archaeon]
MTPGRQIHNPLEKMTVKQIHNPFAKKAIDRKTVDYFKKQVNALVEKGHSIVKYDLTCNLGHATINASGSNLEQKENNISLVMFLKKRD